MPDLGAVGTASWIPFSTSSAAAGGVAPSLADVSSINMPVYTSLAITPPADPTIYEHLYYVPAYPFVWRAP